MKDQDLKYIDSIDSLIESSLTMSFFQLQNFQIFKFINYRRPRNKRDLQNGNQKKRPTDHLRHFLRRSHLLLIVSTEPRLTGKQSQNIA